MHAYTLSRQPVQGVRRGGHRVVLAVGGPAEGARHPQEGPSDDPVDLEGRHEHRPGPLAPVVEGAERHDLLVSGDLEDRVGRGVEDRAPGPHVLGAEPVDDLGARGRDVAEWFATGDRGERLDQLARKTVRKRRKGHLRSDTGHLPMTRDRVLAPGPLRKPGDKRLGRSRRRDPADLGEMAKPEPLAGRHGKAANSLGNVRDRVRSRRVAVLRSIGQGADASRV